VSAWRRSARQDESGPKALDVTNASSTRTVAKPSRSRGTGTHADFNSSDCPTVERVYEWTTRPGPQREMSVASRPRGARVS
jgi:hypothetical protein